MRHLYRCPVCKHEQYAAIAAYATCDKCEQKTGRYVNMIIVEPLVVITTPSNPRS
jgi:ribosomal protein L37AE/L43A